MLSENAARQSTDVEESAGSEATTLSIGVEARTLGPRWKPQFGGQGFAVSSRCYRSATGEAYPYP